MLNLLKKIVRYIDTVFHVHIVQILPIISDDEMIAIVHLYHGGKLFKHRIHLSTDLMESEDLQYLIKNYSLSVVRQISTDIIRILGPTDLNVHFEFLKTEPE